MKNLKRVVTSAAILFAITTAFASVPFTNGPVIMIVSLEVKNFADWKKGFDAGAHVREKAGIKVLSVCTSMDNQNKVMVIEEAANAETAYNFMTLLKSKQKVGELSALEVKVYDKSE
jgi:hypothetical protein